MVRDRRLALEGLESRRVMAGLVAVASDAGATATSHIRLLDAETGAQVAATTTPVFEAGFKGGVRLAMGDVTGDGIVDLVATGRTLRENGLVEREPIFDSTARLIANRVSHKVRAAELDALVAWFEAASS